MHLLVLWVRTSKPFPDPRFRGNDTLKSFWNRRPRERGSQGCRAEIAEGIAPHGTLDQCTEPVPFCIVRRNAVDHVIPDSLFKSTHYKFTA
jgi:hypothetical protein